MKIQVENRERSFTVPLPTTLVFSRGTAWLANHFGRKYAEDMFKDIPPQAMKAMMAEFRRIKKKYGTWELVDVESADGQRVKVIL